MLKIKQSEYENMVKRAIKHRDDIANGVKDDNRFGNLPTLEEMKRFVSQYHLDKQMDMDFLWWFVYLIETDDDGNDICVVREEEKPLLEELRAYIRKVLYKSVFIK